MTEHLKALYQDLTHPAGANTTIAVDKETAHKLVQPPDGVDKTLWLYELCRFLTQKVNSVIVALFEDNPPCSSTTCPEMRASEWQYLCAVHDPPKSCCAIDYCCHTLDWAANILTSPKTFPSRLALGNDQGTQHQQIRQLTNIFRRVYRIFAHAWFQHREMFWKVEGRSGLYILFKTVCDVYGLIPEDNYTIPPEAEGIEEPQAAPPMILRREPSDDAPHDLENTSIIDDHALSTAGTTKRHRHSPSVGATAVSTVVEESEEEEDRSTQEEPSVIEVTETEVPQDPEAAEDATAREQPKASEEAGADAAEERSAEPGEVLEAPDEAEKQSTSEVEEAEPLVPKVEPESDFVNVDSTASGSNETEKEVKAESAANVGSEDISSTYPEDSEKEKKGDLPSPRSVSTVKTPGRKQRRTSNCADPYLVSWDGTVPSYRRRHILPVGGNASYVRYPLAAMALQFRIMQRYRCRLSVVISSLPLCTSAGTDLGLADWSILVLISKPAFAVALTNNEKGISRDHFAKARPDS